MIDLNDVIAGLGPTGARSGRKAFRGHCDRRSASQANFRVRCDNATRLNPASGTKPKHAILERVTDDTLLSQPTFSPLPGILLAIAFIITVGLVAGPSDGKVITCVGALVWFYILFFSEATNDRSTPVSSFDAAHLANRRSSDRIDAPTAQITNTVSTAVWSMRPPARHALTYSDLTSFRPPSSTS